MARYINHIDDFKAGLIFTYMRDIETVYKNYLNNDIAKKTAISVIQRLFSYLKGFLYGCGVTYVDKILFENGKRLEYISFFNNPSRSIKYTLCACFEFKDFAVKYTISERKKDVR